MKKNIIFIALSITIIFLTVSCIYATDINATNYSNIDGNESIGFSDNSNVLSFNNGDSGFGKFSNGVNGSSKLDVNLSAPSIELYYKNGTRFSAYLTDSNGNPLFNQSITFKLYGMSYTRQTDENGVASIGFNLNPSTYDVTVSYAGTDIYNSAQVISTAKVLATIDGKNIVKYYRNGTQYYATFLDGLGNPLANRNVTFNIYGVFYTRTTNSSGVAKLNINLHPGKYVITAIHPDTQLMHSNSITVLKDVPTYLSVQNISCINKPTINLSARLYDSLGNYLFNQTVYFTINEKTYSAVTNKEGIAKLSLKLDEGTYNVYYKFKGSYAYASTSAVSTLTVNSKIPVYVEIKNTIFNYNKGEGFTIKLKDKDGNALVNKTVIFKIWGRTYPKVTNSSGIAKLNINLEVGAYDMVYSFSDDSYASINGSCIIHVVSTNVTELKYYNTTFHYGDAQKFNVILTAGGVPIANRLVKFTIYGREYNRTTDNNGVAGITIRLSPGTYPITFKFNGESKLKPCENSTTITVINSVSNNNANGYWLFGRDMYNANLASLKDLGTGNIFLNYYAFSLYGESKVLAWINQANSYGIKVHIWMQVFYNGGWISPITSSGQYNYDVFNQRINEAKHYAGLSGVSGIHFDYVRFGGTAYKYSNAAESITYFVKSATEAIRAINPNLIISAAVMPETTNNVYYYGQDVPKLSKYLDVIVPMVYKGNYNAGTSWITSVTNWFVSNSAGASIWVGLQSYRSDDDITQLSASELANDAQAALNGGAAGVFIFRWGITKFINFNDLSYPSHDSGAAGNKASLSSIKSAASSLKSYIESKGVLPSTVTVGGVKYSVYQFLYLMAKALLNENSGSANDVESIKVDGPYNSHGDVIYAKILKTEYISMANSIVSFINSNGRAPDHINSSFGNVKYTTLVYMYSKVLAYIDSKSIIPNFVYVTNLLDNYTLTVTMLPSGTGTISSGQYQYIPYTTTWLNYCPHCKYYGTLLVNPKGVPEGEFTCAYCDADYCGVSGLDKCVNPVLSLTRLSDSIPFAAGAEGNNLTITSILKAAESLKVYIEANSNLPNYVAVNDRQYSVAQFLYLMTLATNNINNNNFSNIKVIDVDTPTGSTGNIINSQLNKSGFLDVAQRVSSFILSNKLAPNYASSTLGNIAYTELVDAFSRILTFYKSNNCLPNYVTITYSGGSSSSISELAASLTKGLTTELERATTLFNYVRDYISYSSYYNTQKGAEGTLTSGSGNCCDQSQLLVALARSNGLTVRFATGDCTFTSGLQCGHVWVQFYIGGTWYVADPTSSRNSFNVINNWNTNTYTPKGYFDVLPY